MLHKIQTFNPSLDFVSNPIQILSGSNISRNISAVSSGRTIGGSGTRLWDTNIVPATSTQQISATNPFTLPFTTANLPAFFFDCIVVVNGDGQRMPVAVSNSPDNAIYSSSQPVNNNNLFWLNLYCYRLNNSILSANNSLNHYMFSGNSTQGGAFSNFVISFTEPLTSNLTLTYKAGYYRYTGGLLHQITGSTVLVANGQLDYTFYSARLSDVTYFATGISFFTTPGYWKISLEINDPSFRSLLPFYHWGCSD